MSRGKYERSGDGADIEPLSAHLPASIPLVHLAYCSLQILWVECRLGLHFWDPARLDPWLVPCRGQRFPHPRNPEALVIGMGIIIECSLAVELL